jgi:hypothetical protein
MRLIGAYGLTAATVANDRVALDIALIANRGLLNTDITKWGGDC